MTYVYILSDHDENGAENVTATLDRTRLMDMVDEKWTLAYCFRHGTSMGVEGQTEGRAKFLNKGLKGLAEHLEKTDEELAKGDGWNCHSGWGGIQLHVVRLV